jgi:AbrB family looped-hinge helix DNA binding protein
MLPAVVGSRGRVVLPRQVREALGVAEGDTLFFVVQGEHVRLTRAPSDFGEYLGMFGGGPADFSVEDAEGAENAEDIQGF